MIDALADVVVAGPSREPAVGSSTMNAKATDGDGPDVKSVDADFMNAYYLATKD